MSRPAAGKGVADDVIETLVDTAVEVLTDTWRVWVPVGVAVGGWWAWTREPAVLDPDMWLTVKRVAVAVAVVAVVLLLARVVVVVRGWTRRQAVERGRDALDAVKVDGDIRVTAADGTGGYVQLARTGHLTAVKRRHLEGALSAKLGADIELGDVDTKDRVPFHRRRVVDVVELPKVVPVPLGRPVAESGVIEYGVGPDGEVLRWDQRVRPHCLVTGETGSGKTGVMRALIFGALRAGYAVRILDPKKREFRALDGLPRLKRAGDGWDDEAINGMSEMIEAVHHEMRRRYDLTDAEIDALPRILFVVDEYYELVAALNRWFKENKKELELSGSEHPAVGLLTSLSTLARSAGIHLLFGIQRPDTKVMGHEGGLIRAQLGYRISVGPLDRNGAIMMWDDHWEAGLAVPEIKGRVLRTAPGGPQLGQVWWVDLNDDEVVAACRRVKLSKG